VSPPGDVDVAPDESTDSVVLRTSLPLVKGESRRVEDRLGATLSTSEGAEVDNGIVCLDPSGTPTATSSGTNHPGAGAGQLGLMESVLLAAPVSGTYTCQIVARTSDGSRTNFAMTAVKSGTWLRISSADEVGSHAWSNQECNSPGDFLTCVYLGGFETPNEAHIFTDQDVWSAATDTTQVDVVGTFQITSCYYGTGSCVSRHWGFAPPWSVSRFQSFLELNQLNPDGSICRTNRSSDDGSPSTDTNPGDGVYEIPNSVHHLPIHYHLTAPVAANCNGSRRFVLDLAVKWTDGNPIKLDNGGFNVIQSVRGAPTVTVPKNAVGLSEGQAFSVVSSSDLKPVTVARVMSPAPVGTVVAENSPGGTIEPAGSEVDLTVSAGQATVPNLISSDESSAVRGIRAAGLVVGQVSSVNNCLDPGLVQVQNPRGGALVVPGSSVSITVATCSSGHPK
jgi:hypothetical protein